MKSSQRDIMARSAFWVEAGISIQFFFCSNHNYRYCIFTEVDDKNVTLVPLRIYCYINKWVCIIVISNGWYELLRNTTCRKKNKSWANWFALATAPAWMVELVKLNRAIRGVTLRTGMDAKSGAIIREGNGTSSRQGTGTSATPALLH